VLPLLLLLVAGGGDLARAYFVGIQMSDGAREAALYLAANPPYTSASYTAALPPSGTYTGCPTTSGGAEGPAVDAGCQAFAGSLLTCPTGGISWSFTPTSLPTQTPPNTLGDSFTVKVTAVCKMNLILALVAPSVTIRSTGSASVVQP